MGCDEAYVVHEKHVVGGHELLHSCTLSVVVVVQEMLQGRGVERGCRAAVLLLGEVQGGVEMVMDDR